MKRHLSLFLILLLCFLTACAPSAPLPTDALPPTENSQAVVSETQQPSPAAPNAPVMQDAPTAPLTGTLRAHFIDVGQGDSELLQLPNGQTMLIDAGGDVRSYLQTLGIQKIDYLVATHPHADHIAYMEEVITNFNIGAIYMPRVSHTSKTFENMLLAIQRKGLSIKTAKAGVTILNEGNLNINIVAPVKDTYDDLNNYSTVIKVVYGSTSMLFTGDAEALSEGQITANIDADVLKVGHHGSSTSSSNSFLNRVTPKIAVISCGAGNSYGHPHSETLQKLNSRNVEIYRTDLNGTIVITSDGTNLNTTTVRTTITPYSSSSATQNTTVPEQEADTSTADGNAVVYITRTGKRYHREGCSSLSKSKIPSTVAEATAKGLTPCQNCNP